MKMDAGDLIVQNFTASERRACSSFFSGRESSRSQRDSLRVAIARASNRDLAEAMREFFNGMRTEGEPIPSCLVTSALRLLAA